jgi:hypothetical protein
LLSTVIIGNNRTPIKTRSLAMSDWDKSALQRQNGAPYQRQKIKPYRNQSLSGSARTLGPEIFEFAYWHGGTYFANFFYLIVGASFQRTAADEDVRFAYGITFGLVTRIMLCFATGTCRHFRNPRNRSSSEGFHRLLAFRRFHRDSSSQRVS